MQDRLRRRSDWRLLFEPVSAIFGKLQGLLVLGGPEPPKADESAGESSGLTKILMTIVHGIMVVKNAYNKVAGKVNGIIKSIDVREPKKARFATPSIKTRSTT